MLINQFSDSDEFKKSIDNNVPKEVLSKKDLTKKIYELENKIERLSKNVKPLKLLSYENEINQLLQIPSVYSQALSGNDEDEINSLSSIDLDKIEINIPQSKYVKWAVVQISCFLIYLFQLAISIWQYRAAPGIDILGLASASSDSNNNRLCLQRDYNRTTNSCKSGATAPKDLFDYYTTNKGFTVDIADLNRLCFKSHEEIYNTIIGLLFIYGQMTKELWEFSLSARLKQQVPYNYYDAIKKKISDKTFHEKLIYKRIGARIRYISYVCTFIGALLHQLIFIFVSISAGILMVANSQDFIQTLDTAIGAFLIMEFDDWILELMKACCITDNLLKKVNQSPVDESKEYHCVNDYLLYPGENTFTDFLINLFYKNRNKDVYLKDNKNITYEKLLTEDKKLHHYEIDTKQLNLIKSIAIIYLLCVASLIIAPISTAFSNISTLQNSQHLSCAN